MPDTTLLTRAIDLATAGNTSAFARLLGHRTPGRVFAWRAGTRPLPPIVARVCRLILAHPEVAGWLAEG